MHTVKIVALGLLLLLLCLGLGRAAGSRGKIPVSALVFLPLWFIGAGVNMWIGVSKAGYTIAEEAPIFAVVFGIPALVALGVWKLTRKQAS